MDLHKSGLEGNYGEGEFEEEDEDASDHGERGGPGDVLDFMSDVVAPAAWEELKDTFGRMNAAILKESSCKWKKNAMEAGLGISEAIAESGSGALALHYRFNASDFTHFLGYIRSDLGAYLRRDSTASEIIFIEGLIPLAKKIPPKQLSRLKAEGYVDRLEALKKALDEDEHGDIQKLIKLFDT